MLATQPSALVVNTSLNVNSVAELIDLLKKNPGKYNYGSIGNGSLSHLAMEALALKSGTTMVHIPYPGSPQAMTAVLRNDVQMGCLPAIAVTPQVASGPPDACWRYAAGQWRKLTPDLPLAACAQTLFAGRCVRQGDAAYGRWGQQTLRLVSGRVEISADNRSFRPLMDQAGCPQAGEAPR